MSINSNWRTMDSYPRKNVMTSLLWLSALTFPAGATALMVKPWPGALVFGIGTICVAFTIRYYSFWAKRDPDRLQTEDYRIQKEYVARVVGSVSADDRQLPGGDVQMVSGSINGGSK